MYNLIKWEFKGLFTTNKFKIMLLVMTMIAAVCIGIAFLEKLQTGFDEFARVGEFMVTLNYLASSVFAGMTISSAFQDRMIQSAVMAGNSRVSVVISKSVAYLAAVALFVAFPTIIVTTIINLIFGFGTAITGKIILSMITVFFMSVLLNMATMSFCIPISFCIKNTGVSIGINLGVILFWNGIAQQLIVNPETANWVLYSAMGQSFLVNGDMSTSQIIIATTVALISISVSIILACARFGREELK